MANTKKLTFELELDAKNVNLGDDIAVSLRQNKYKVTPHRDGTLLILAIELAQNAWDNRAILTVMFEAAKRALDYLIKEQKNRHAKEATANIGISSGGKSGAIEANEDSTAEELAAQFIEKHPDVANNLDSDGKTKVKIGLS